MIRLLLMTLLVGQAPTPKTVEALPFDVEALRALPQVKLKVDDGGRSVTYAGVPLAALLRPKDGAELEMPALKGLADSVLLIRAHDGYQVAVSAVAAGMDPKGERYLLALTRDGKPLDAGVGPVRLIVPGDPKHARWIRSVVGVKLVRVSQLVTEP